MAKRKPVIAAKKSARPRQKKNTRPSQTRNLPAVLSTPVREAVLDFALNQALPLRVADMAGNILYANQQFLHAIAPATAEPDAPDLPAIIQQLEAGTQPLQFDLRLNLLDRVYVYRTRHELHNFGPDKHHIVISSYADITEQDFLEHRLRLSQSRMEDLVKLSGDWVWEMDGHLRLASGSVRIMELTGWHVRELLGRDFFSLVQLPDGQAVPKAVLNRAPFRDIQVTMQGRSGEIHTLRLNGMPQFDRADGRFLGYRGTATDLTKTIRAEKIAAMLEQRLSHAIANIDQGFALFDARGYLVIANPMLAQFFPQSAHLLTPGITQGEFMEQIARRGDVDLLGWPMADWLMARAEYFARARKPFEMKLADGRYVLCRDCKIDDYGGTVSLISDISELKQREQELQAARDVADTANRAKGEFFAKMSHELRTPLNAMIGFAEVMAQEKLGRLGHPSYQTYATDIHDAASHLLHIINDILDVSKAEAGKLELVEQNVSLISAVQSSVRMIINRAEQQGVAIDSGGVDKDLVLRADGKKIRQILINLLSNAVKFTPSGGQISVRAQIQNDGQAQITVRDTGIGMKAEDIPKALLAFAQIDNAHNRQFDGTGLGLPLCAALAELHGGKLSLQSNLGQGTTVTVQFPKERVITAQHPA